VVAEMGERMADDVVLVVVMGKGEGVVVVVCACVEVH
jgi:hypothetical protein